MSQRLETLCDQTISALVRWDRLKNGGIIDFDLIGARRREGGSFKDRLEALESFKNLFAALNEYKSCDDLALTKALKTKITASIYYLRALLGEDIPFTEYIIRTMGITPAVIPESKLALLRDYLSAKAKALGFANANQAFTVLHRTTQVTKPPEIQACFKKYEQSLVSRTRTKLKIELDLNYEIKFVNENVYWCNWILTEEARIVLKINLYPDHRWYPARVEVLVSHELAGHALQALAWQAGIARGEIPRIWGLLTVFSPEQFILEGVAQALPDFMGPEYLSAEGQLEHLRFCLGVQVKNNIHLAMNSGGHENQQLEIYRSWLPWDGESDEFLLNQFRSMRDQPLLRTYQYIYGVSQLLLSQIARESSASAALKSCYSRVLTPDQLLGQYKLSWPVSN
ncbi:MAG: hypothetical protein DCC75_01715 [Proteobacteria bacterium]|nr:MAG: hypothetical protein DCC75_01715 [Pseudomonadota bacterium]